MQIEKGKREESVRGKKWQGKKKEKRGKMWGKKEAGRFGITRGGFYSSLTQVLLFVIEVGDGGGIGLADTLWCDWFASRPYSKRLQSALVNVSSNRQVSRITLSS